MSRLRREVANIDALVKHVGCGSVDEIAGCILCDQIRVRLKTAADKYAVAVEAGRTFMAENTALRERAEALSAGSADLREARYMSEGGSLNGPSRLGASRESDTGGEIGHTNVDLREALKQVTALVAQMRFDGERLCPDMKESPPGGFPAESHRRIVGCVLLNWVRQFDAALASASTPEERGK